jgi:acyl carrier protein
MAIISREGQAASVKVLELIAESLSKPGKPLTSTDIDVNHSFSEAGFDSLDSVELTMNFEEVFGIEIKDDEANGLKTIRDLQIMVGQKVTKLAA